MSSAMDERKRGILKVFLNSFLLTDIKKIINRLNERLPARLTRTARKGVLVATIVDQVADYLDNGDNRVLDILVEIMNELRMKQAYEVVDNFIGVVGTRNRFRPDASPDAATNSTLGTASRLSVPSSFQYNVEFKTSPFYTVQSRLAQPKICTSSMNTRASRLFTFEMTAEQLRYFEERDPKDGQLLYEIRFFCTSYDTQSSPHTKDIEFPAICEIKVNIEHTINGSTVRGLKNKPGTAHPADLTSSCHLSSKRNVIEFVYAHTAKPYIGTVELVKRSPVADIVENLKATSIISKQETLQRLQERQADTDIVLESETISTKCPLGFTRIKTPSRSKQCQHLQCFDATTFLLMNQQTPTWSCPICNRKMDSWEEVGVDEYFQDILAQVSENVDTIRIEDGGKFRVLNSDEMDGDTDDDSEHTERTDDTKTNNKRSLGSHENSTTGADHGTENRIDAVTILDDDDDDDLNSPDPDDIPLSKRHKTTTTTPQPAEPSVTLNNSHVIDLTLDSGDEETTEDSSSSSSSNNNNNDNGYDSWQPDELNTQNTLPNPPTSTTSTSQSMDQNETNIANQQSTALTPTAITTTTTATTTTSPIANESASPATTKTANSTLSPRTPPRNLIRLPWPPTPRQPSLSTSAPSTYQFPALNFSQQPTPPPASSSNVYIVPPNASSQPPSTPSPVVNSTPLNSFLHK